MAPPPPPPPPHPPTGGTNTKRGGAGDGYYSSNAGSSSSNAARQRLGLTKQRNAAAGETRTTAAPGGMTSSSSGDWFASPGPAASVAASSLSAIPAAPAPANSGFYSINSTAGAGSNDNTYSNYANNQYGTNQYGSNPYGINSSNMSSGSGFVGEGYYGGSSSGYASQINSHAMTGAIGGGGVSAAIPPASAFGSNTNGINSMNSFEMNGSLGGAIGGPSTISTAVAPAPNVFDPNVAAAKKAETYSGINNAASPTYEEDYYNEPPLLEELGVNFPHIYSKSRAVLFPFGKHAKSLESGLIENDADLAGPLAFALGLGGELLLSGKLHFGYVYGFGVSGCFFMTFLLNLLNPNGAVSMWTVVSILGYALLPVNLLAGINILMRVHKLGIWGMVMAVLTIAWCTTASARLFERGCNMREQRFLVAYPTALLYSAFVIITIF